MNVDRLYYNIDYIKLKDLNQSLEILKLFLKIYI